MALRNGVRSFQNQTQYVARVDRSEKPEWRRLRHLVERRRQEHRQFEIEMDDLSSACKAATTRRASQVFAARLDLALRERARYSPQLSCQ